MILLLSSITDLHQKACIPRHATCYRKGPKNGICGKAARTLVLPPLGAQGARWAAAPRETAGSQPSPASQTQLPRPRGSETPNEMV